MKIIGGLILVCTIGLAAAIYAFGFASAPATPADAAKVKNMYDFTMKNIDGADVSLGKYKKNVVMIVNTASKCGYTPQYEGLEKIYEKYKDKGFVILGFPANNFGAQEPGTETEIKEFCTLKYHVSFPMFSKISVKGEDQHPLYAYLTGKETDPQFAGDITWNFNKFLVDRQGNVVARFSSKDTPESDTVTAAIEKYLADK
ncbi:MAG: glutathione peroxidase [Acidobacteriota bacterium]